MRVAQGCYERVKTEFVHGETFLEVSAIRHGSNEARRGDDLHDSIRVVRIPG